MRLHRLLLRGARKVAAAAPDNEIDRLWREADLAAARFESALEKAPAGADLRALPEFETWRLAAQKFRWAAEKKVLGKDAAFKDEVAR